MKGFGGGGMQALMRQANQMQTRMKKAQDELATREFESSSGGGAIKIVMMGDYKIKSIEIQDDVIGAGDKEMLQDLIASSVNEALRTVKTTSEAEMAKITGGFNIPGM